MSDFDIAYVLNSRVKKYDSGVPWDGGHVTVLRVYTGLDECVGPCCRKPSTGHKYMWDVGLKTNRFVPDRERIGF